RYAMTFNGEIYNYRELQPELESCGHRFRTHSDTEVIVHAYEEWGVECLQRLRGMFGFVIWDSRKQRLFLARDRMGQKPLFYRRESDRLTFASELKALLQVPDAPRELDHESVDLFLTYQYVPHPRCILKGYNKLPPGHYALYEQGNLTIDRYWHAPYAQHADPLQFAVPDLALSDRWSPDDWQQQVRETLTESVRLRMRSDVPIGAFLSGGIDSTIISGLMQSLSDRPIHTFSIGFPVEKFDERKYAREAAEFVNLYSKSRGVNRFPGLIETLVLLADWAPVQARGYQPHAPQALVDWVGRETKLGNPALAAAVAQTGDADLKHALAWSEKVNADIAAMVRGVPPFPCVRESLEKLSGVADILVVSATPNEALGAEWSEHGLDQFVRAICGQESGSKKETLANAAKYGEHKTLIRGDAPGDYRAAVANHALFYPINPGHEEESWERFHGEGLERFLSGTFAGAYQQQLLDEFEKLLPATPPWKS
ncbi:MAG: asparagine synthase (glutamine-hydrolyzing), partial [Planctomycetales bacterium]|nr:asparagine synthase (glutamine-hydrolyzing) [Planctomycetales bacterium]